MRRLLSLLLVTGALATHAAPATAEEPLLGPLSIDNLAQAVPRVGETWTPTVLGVAAPADVDLTGTPGVCTVADGVVAFDATGTCAVTATAAGDADPLARRAVVELQVALREVDLALTTAPDRPSGGDTVTVTATATDRLDGSAVAGTATLAATGTSPSGAHPMTGTGGVLTRTFTVTGGTTHALTVVFAPSSAVRWAGATATRTVTGLSSQVVTLDSPDPARRHVGEEWTPVTTGGGSTAPVTLTGTAGVCTVAGGVVSLVAAGTCTVTARQAGDEEHAAADPVSRTFAVVRRPVAVEISWSDPPPPAHGDDVLVTAVVTDGLDGTAVAGTATLTATGTGTTGARAMTGTGTGVFSRTVTVSGGTTHALTVAFTPATPATWAAGTASADLAVAKAAQDVTISAVPAAADLLVGRTWTPTTTGGGSGNAVTLTAAPSTGRNAVCTVPTTSPATVRFLGHGTCTVTATQAGDAHHLAGSAHVTLEVRRPITVTVTTDPATPRYGDEVTVVASAVDALDGSVVPLAAGTDGLTVHGSGAVATTDGDDLALTFEPGRAGDHAVAVAVAGSERHQGLTHTETLAVARALQVLRVPEADRPDPGLVGSSWTPAPQGGGAATTARVTVHGTSEACSVTAGVVRFDAPGTCPLRFSKDGDADHEPAPDLLVTLQVRVPVQLTLQGTPAAPVVGTRVELRAVARTGGVAAVGTGAITVTGPDGTLGTDPDASWYGGGRFLAFRPARAATYTVTATFHPADAATYAVATRELTVTVGRAGQAITVGTPPPSPARVLGTWAPVATGGGSGHAVTLTSRTPGTCTVRDDVVSFVAAGSCRVDLDQAGGADHLAAPTLTREVAVELIPVTVTVGWPGTPRVAEDLLVTATATATLPDGTTTTVPGTGTLAVGDEGTTTGAWTDGARALALTPAHAGDHPVTATFIPTRTGVYRSGTAPAGLVLPVARGTQSITLGTEPGPTAYVGDRWTPAAAGHGSGQPVGLAVDAGPAETPACRLEDGDAGPTVVHLHAGTCTLTADLAGDADHLPAPRLVRAVEVLRHPTTVDVEVAGTALVARDLPVAATVSGLRHATTPTAVGGSVTFLVDGAPVGDPVPLTGARATTVLRLPSAGDHTVAAAFAPDDPVLWATAAASETVATARNPQAITLGDGAPTAAVVDGTWTPAASASSGLVPVVGLHPDSVADGVCALAAGTVTFLEPGACTVLLDQPGDPEYLPAARHAHDVAVDRTVTTTTVTVAGGAQVGSTAEVTATSDGTGAIAFSLLRGTDPPVALGDPVPLVDGTARLAVVPQAVARHEVVGTLLPDPARVYHPSTGSATWPVAKAPTAVAVTVTAGRVAVRVTSGTPAGGVPTGRVRVTAGAADPVDLVLDGGTATLPDVLPPDADLEVTAAYAGDGTRAAATATVRRGLPTLTHTLSGSPGPDGWHDRPVTVSFRCAASTAPLAGACPEPVRLRADRADQGVLRSVTAADGGRAVLRVDGVHIDATAPRAGVAGVRDGATYLGSVAAARCSASDATSGIRSCVVLPRQRLGRTELRDTVVATDRAGNTRTASVRFRVLPEWVHRGTLHRGRWVVRGRSATLRVLGDSRAPKVLRPRRPGGAPTVAAGLMTPIRISNGVWLWKKTVPIARVRGRRPYRLAVQTGTDARRVLRVVVRRP